MVLRFPLLQLYIRGLGIHARGEAGQGCLGSVVAGGQWSHWR